MIGNAGELERLKDEREEIQKQVDIFSSKYKQNNTVWHKTLDRINIRISELEGADLYQKELDNG